MKNMSKEQIEMNIKYLIEEKKELERQIKAGEEAKKAIIHSQDKLEQLMQEYLGE